MERRTGKTRRYVFLAWAAIAALGLALGCTDGDDDSTGDDDAAGDANFAIDTALSEYIGTVATVTWSVDDLGVLDAAHVEFGLDGSYGQVAPCDVSGDGPYEVRVWGMKPAEDYQLRVVAEADGTTYNSAPHTLITGAAPVSLPSLSVETYGNSDMAAGGFLLTSVFTLPPAAVILDGDGDYVWWHVDEDNTFTVCRARISADRQWIYYWAPNVGLFGPGDGEPDQKLVRVSIDGGTVQNAELPDGHHDFFALPDGNLALLEYDEITVVDQPIDGDKITEMAPNGDKTQIYSVWDDLTYEPIPMAPGESWSHANALRYIEDQDAYYMGFRSFDGIFKIDRSSGELLWVLGGLFTDFAGTENLFSAQHGFQVLGDDRLVVFVNSEPMVAESTVMEIVIDEGAMTAELVWEYHPDPTMFSHSLGDVWRFDSGNTLVTYSNSGQIDEVDESGELLWRLNAGLGGALGYSEYLEDLYVAP